MKNIELWADGFCEPNPGRGGWGCIIVENGQEREFSGGEHHTTNNRMELMGIIGGLEQLKEPCTGIIYSDSKYALWACEKKAHWQKKMSAGVLPNSEYVEHLWKLLAPHNFVCQWVKGHSGVRLNERADVLAKTGPQNERGPS